MRDTTFGGPVYSASKRASLALKHVINWWKIQLNSKIFLAGFSRGAAAVIETAKWLKDQGIPVECLILFDPVDRCHIGGVGGGVLQGGRDTPIVDTVRTCIKVLRHPSAESRESFGNCGQVFESPATQIFATRIHATHGGIGGTPWGPAYVPPGSMFIDEGLAPNSGFTSIPYEPHELDGMTKVTVAQDLNGSIASWNFVTTLLKPMIDRAQKELETPAMPELGSDDHIYPTRISVPVLTNHTVMPGESLSLISMKYYGTFMKWEKIYEVNRSTIGGNPNLIHPKMELVIPKL